MTTTTYYCPNCHGTLHSRAAWVNDSPKYATVKVPVHVDFFDCQPDCILRNNTLGVEQILDKDEITVRYEAAYRYDPVSGAEL